MNSNSVAAPAGPITSQVNRHSDQVNELHRAIDGLTSRLNPILCVSPPSGAKEMAKAVPICELTGRLTDTNDSFSDALSRIEELQNRIQL